MFRNSKIPYRILKTPNSGNSYYFRAYIPQDLIQQVGGQKSFRISLQSGIPSHSKKLSRNLSIILEKIFLEIRAGMRSLTIEDIKEILRIEIRKSILHSHHVHLGTNEFSDEAVNESLNYQRTRKENLKNTLQQNLKEYESRIDETLEEILSTKEIEIHRDSVDYKQLRRNFVKIHNLRLKWIENLLENRGRKDSDFEAEAENLLGIDLYEREEKVVQTPNRSIQSVSGANCVLETIESYLNWKRLEKTAERTIWEKKAVIEEFFEITELEFMEQVSKEVIRNYITIQSKLPLNRKKNPKYRDKTISQILEMQNVEVQGVNNINKKLTVLTAFGNWSEKNGFLNQNLFSGMKLDAKKAGAVERENFTDQDLKKILNPQTYLSSTIQGISSVTKKPISNREAYYWIFLLGIFSGMRTNEMTQLRLDDFQQIDGVWMIQVDETEETRVKTRNSIRKVPVHPKLIELGILDYIQKLRKQKQDRFFWELKMVRGKYGKEVSRFYNEKYLKEVGVWKQTVKVLYCTRHTLIHNLYRKGVDENVIKTLVGHEKEFTMKHYGGNPYDAENLLNEISKVEYSSVDFGSLKVDWKKMK